MHESVLSRKLVFWTSKWKHVIKYDLQVKFPRIFAHNVQIRAKFSYKNVIDVCPVFWILRHYTQGRFFVDTLYIHFRRLWPPNGILPGIKFTLRPRIAFSYIGSVTARHSSSLLSIFRKLCHTTRYVLKLITPYMGVYMCSLKIWGAKKPKFSQICGPKIGTLSPAIP